MACSPTKFRQEATELLGDEEWELKYKQNLVRVFWATKQDKDLFDSPLDGMKIKLSTVPIKNYLLSKRGEWVLGHLYFELYLK